MPPMPELPDVCVYVEALRRQVAGQALERVAVLSPFVLRSYDPPLMPSPGASWARPAASASGSFSHSTTISLSCCTS